MTDQEKRTGQSEASPERLPEPWLRGTRPEIAPIERAVLHSLELAREDINKWCAGLDDRQLHAQPFGLPSAAFQLLHIARSVDRFLTYADGQMLSDAQLAALAGEKDPAPGKEELFREFHSSLETATQRILATPGRSPAGPVKVGRKGLSTTSGGLLVHMAEHTQRHVGQAITTAKIVMAVQPPSAGPKS